MKQLSDKLRKILGELREQFEEVYGDRLVEIVLYGSQARGDADAESDIDVLVVLEGPVDQTREYERTRDWRLDLLLAEGALVSIVFMDEDRFTHRHGPFLRNVRREGIRV